MGDFDGQLYTISESGQKNKFAKLKYPAFHIIDLIDGVMVASGSIYNLLIIKMVNFNGPLSTLV